MARSHKHRVPAAFGGIMDTKTGRKKYFLGSVWDWAKDNATELLKMAGSGVKGYLDYKDAKKRGELEEAAYDDYIKAAEAAGQEARAAVDLNLTPMTVTNIPTTKADVTDYTAATGLKHGGISGLRKKYARGPGETEVLEMDEEVITPYDLQKEEGVEIGEQVFYNTGKGDRANAMMIWDQMSVPDKSIFDFDFELFFQDGSWRDMIKGEAPSGKDKMMASAPSMGDSQNEAAMQLFNKPYDQLNEMELQMFQEEMSKYMAKGGIAGLRKKYAVGTDEVEVMEMEEEPLGDFELKQEEGVQIGPMAGPDWYIKRIEHLEFLGYDYEEASEIAFDDDKYYSIVGMESAIPRGGEPGQDSKGIMAAAKGGRARYDSGTDWIVKRSDVEEEDSPIGRKGAGLSPDQIDEFKWGIEPKEKKEFNINDLIITLDDKSIYQGEPIIIQDVRTGKWKVMGNDGRVIEFDTIEEAQTYKKQIAPFAKGGRARKANGGIMDLGGLEKDYRFSGGFVPIGEYEKKDDVPARLSKNEFVFTADAVRAAGGGSINKGAKRMYETMKNLEARPEAKRMTA